MKKETKVKRKYTKKIDSQKIAKRERSIQIVEGNCQYESLEILNVNIAKKEYTGSDVLLWANKFCRQTEGIFKSMVHGIIIGDKKIVKEYKSLLARELNSIPMIITKFEKEYKKGQKKCSTK